MVLSCQMNPQSSLRSLQVCTPREAPRPLKPRFYLHAADTLLAHRGHPAAGGSLAAWGVSAAFISLGRCLAWR